MKILRFFPIFALVLLIMMGCDANSSNPYKDINPYPDTGNEGGDGDGEGEDSDEEDEAEEAYGTPEHLNPSYSDYQFTNPVLYADCPDPSMIFDENGRCYIYGTSGNLHVYSSDDLVNWTYECDVFDNTTRPRPESNGLWAPDMNYTGGHYLFYYTVNTGSGSTRYINVMTSDSPIPPFTAQGTVIDYATYGVNNSIDQCYWEEEDGSKWMFWGSFNDIYAIELSDDGFTGKSGTQKQYIAGTMIEGTMIYKRGDYYYLIGSAGSYGGSSGYNGVGATYHLVVARSTDLLGPYRDKDGGLATSNHFSKFMNESEEVCGPGHCSEVFELDDGTTWFFYHGWPYDDLYYGRVDYLSQIFWDNYDWPYVLLDKPSVTWDKPPVNPTSFTYSPVDYIEFWGEDKQDRFAFDTGFVPTDNTIIETKVQAYSLDSEGNSTLGHLRRIFQANTSNSTGFSVYLNSEGTKFGYTNFGGDDSGIVSHDFTTCYEITATLSNITVNGEFHTLTAGSSEGRWERITLFGGPYGYPFMGRMYYFKIYDGSTLVHDFEPVLRNEDQMVMLYDTVTGNYYLPYDSAGFGYGNVVNE